MNPNAPSFVPTSTDLGNGVTNTNLRKNLRNNSTSNIQINEEDDAKSLLGKIRNKNRDRPIIAHLNINYLDPKFEPLVDIIKNNIDILLVSETKLDDSFQPGKYSIEGYKEPIRLDRDKNGGGLIFLIRDDLNGIEVKSHKLTKKKQKQSLLN